MSNTQPSPYSIQIETVGHTNIPAQTLTYMAMRACKHFTYKLPKPMPDEHIGEIVIDHLLGKNDTKSHFGPAEHWHITTFSENVPRYVLEQIRTHRTGITFDAYSWRDGGVKKAQEVLDGLLPLEAFFELTPNISQDYFMGALKEYVRIGAKDAEEARGVLPHCYLTTFMMTVNLRSALHLCDLRIKGDVQGSTQTWCKGLHGLLTECAPQIMAWYDKNRLGKARLAP